MEGVGRLPCNDPKSKLAGKPKQCQICHIDADSRQCQAALRMKRIERRVFAGSGVERLLTGPAPARHEGSAWLTLQA